jgi:hypothetical protein
MPDARGRFLGISVPAEAWERVFGDRMAAHDHDWPCAHAQVEYESHSLIRYCGDCGVDLD